MNIEVKLYKTFDADLLSLQDAGISIPMMVRLTLFYFCRGRRLRIHTPSYLRYDLDGKKRCTHYSINISDPVTERYLRSNLKKMQRTAFIKAVLRDAMMDQAVGVYLAGDKILDEEDKLLNMRRGRLPARDIFIVDGEKVPVRFSNYYKKIGNPSIGISDSELQKYDRQSASGKKADDDYRRYGELADLAYKNQKRNQKKKDNAEEKTPAKETDGPVPVPEKKPAKKKPVATPPSREKEKPYVPPAADDEKNVSGETGDFGFDDFDEDDLFGRFESL